MWPLRAAVLGNDVVCENPHRGAPAFKHAHFKATIMVDMDMQARLRKA
jgi:hypothetical protein